MNQDEKSEHWGTPPSQWTKQQKAFKAPTDTWPNLNPPNPYLPENKPAEWPTGPNPYVPKVEDLQKQVLELTQELSKAKATAEDGYKQAWDIIAKLQSQLEAVKNEGDTALEEGFQEAYEILAQERKLREQLEVDLYNEFDRKVNDIKNYMVDKVDMFLKVKFEELVDLGEVEAAKRLKEWQEAFTAAELVEQAVTDGEGMPEVDVKVLQARVMRLNMENNQLREEVRQLQAANNAKSFGLGGIIGTTPNGKSFSLVGEPVNTCCHYADGATSHRAD